MKVLWLSHLIPYPPKAGVLLRAYHLINELSKHHSVDLLAFSQRSLVEPYFDSYEEGCRVAREKMEGCCNKVEFITSPVDEKKHGKLRCAIASLFSKHPYNINWLKSEKYRNTLASWIESENYDVIHFDTISLAPYLDNLPIESDMVFSLDHHNIESHMLLRRAKKETNLFKKLYFMQEGYRLEKTEQSYCPRFHLNITCSKLDSERLLDFCPGVKCVDIPNGVDLKSFTPSEQPPDSCSFIFIGTLDWYPNQEAVEFIAEELWPHLKVKYPDAVVHIIGANPPQKLVRITDNDERFHVHGFVDDLDPYLSAATVYLCPISDGGGTKLKILDAFASGKAVVGHPVTFEGFDVIDGRHAELAESVDQYLEKIDKIVTDSDHRVALEKAARTHVEKNFSFDSIGAKLASSLSRIKSDNSCVE